MQGILAAVVRLLLAAIAAARTSKRLLRRGCYHPCRRL